MADDEEFQSQDAGSAESYPIEAGQIRKGGMIMIKGRPCKVIDVSSSKTGKHGHAKCHFVATDIFTGKKLEDLVPASHTTYAPFVKKIEYQVSSLARRAAHRACQRPALPIPAPSAPPRVDPPSPPHSATPGDGRRRGRLCVCDGQ